MSSSSGEVSSAQNGLPDAYEQALLMTCETENSRRLCSAAEAEQTREKDRQHFDGILDRLVQKVTADYKDKVISAAREGQRSVEVFVFDGGDKMEGTEHSLLFLLRGPRRQGQEFFLRLGLLPFMARMWQQVRPFDVDMTYEPEGNLNTLRLKW